MIRSIGLVWRDYTWELERLVHIIISVLLLSQFHHGLSYMAASTPPILEKFEEQQRNERNKLRR